MRYIGWLVRQRCDVRSATIVCYAVGAALVQMLQLLAQLTVENGVYAVCPPYHVLETREHTRVFVIMG